MDTERIRADLNLHAVLQNIEELARLDRETEELIKSWNVTIQFSVRKGPSCFLEFRDGKCRHGIGSHTNPDIRLYFLSCSHLNGMFAGKANPIPIKGFSRLGFLKSEFSKLTDRLTFYLKPDTSAKDAEFIRINTTLTMNTALFAVKELALSEPTCMKIASHIPAGVLQVEVLPQGPCGYIGFGAGRISVGKCAADGPNAVMAFVDMDSANALLSGKLDAFLAVAEGKMTLKGQLPLIDGTGLILDRVERYLK